MQIIGEAARKLSDEFKKSKPEMPWIDIIGMRNKIVHDYFDIDNKFVWDTIKNDLPKLEQVLKKN